MVLNEGTFGVRVCVEAFLISRATSPGWGVRGNGGGVGVRMEEEHDVIHGVAREFREFCRGV